VRDPLRNPEPLIRCVYAYAAYRLGDGSDAEAVTSDAFERARRYRQSFDPRRETPAVWLVGIARGCVDGRLRGRGIEVPAGTEALHDGMGGPAPADLTSPPLDLAGAVATLGVRDRDLIALRYGAGLKVKEIARLLGQTTDAVEVALRRTLDRLHAVSNRAGATEPARHAIPLDSRPASRPET
jgi:RNA polymerase sigma-70 factor (ECF subfamily)